MLPLEKDPCEGCLVSMLCEQMCPKVIEFYSKRVRKRPKHEVEQATGYYWEDDYTDDKGVVHQGRAQHRLREKKKEIISYTPIMEEPGVIEKFMNFIDKRIIICLQKNKNTLKG